MKLCRAVLACLLAAGLALATPLAAGAGEYPMRGFALHGPTGPVSHGSQARVEVIGWSTHPTRIRVQQQSGAEGWTDLAVLDVPAADDRNYLARVPLPTDVPGDYQVRLLLDAGPDFPDEEVVGPLQVTVTAPVPTVETRVRMSRVTEPRPRLREPVAVTGTVGGGFARTVELQVDAHRGWATIATTTSRANGDYRFAVPTDWYYAGPLRVFAPAAQPDDTLHLAGHSTSGGRITVSPGYRPRGRAKDWTDIYGGRRVSARWDPCRTISWRVNLEGAPGGALAMTRKALGIAHDATGLLFSYAGRTDAVPFRDTRGPEYSDADLTIAFTSPRQVHAFRGRWGVVGLGGYSSGSGAINRGGVSLDRTWRARSDFGHGSTWGVLLLHEVGHALGLGHARGREQVMHSGINAASRGRYEAGDLAGLARFGAAGGCLGPADALGRSAPPVTVKLP